MGSDHRPDLGHGLQASAANDGEESSRRSSAARYHCKTAVAARNGGGAASRLCAADCTEASEENRKSDSVICRHLEAIIDATIGGASSQLRSESWLPILANPKVLEQLHDKHFSIGIFSADLLYTLQLLIDQLP